MKAVPGERTLGRSAAWGQCAAMMALAWMLCAAMATAATVELKVATASGVLLAGKKQNTYLKVGLKGIAEEAMKSRPPLNVALVLDKSGSMGGSKMEQAREAARMFVEGLAPDDIVSIVTYDDTVHVLVPATKASDRDLIFSSIATIEASGSTALFAGVSKGAAEVRKFLKEERVNRVVLLSDGLANVGPSSPSELASLGHSFIKEGIAVTTIGLGLGYNEDLMSDLAMASDGNHAFVVNETDLAQIFKNELGAASSILAQDVRVKIRFPENIRPLRVLGGVGEIEGRNAHIKFNQIYGNHERDVVIEVEVPECKVGAKQSVAEAEVSYHDLRTKSDAKLKAVAEVTFSDSSDVVAKSVDKEIMVSAVALVATENSMLATKLRDEGRIEEAKDAIITNSGYLSRNSVLLQSEELDKMARQQLDDSKNLDEANYNSRRKSMKEAQQGVAQKSYKIKQ